ncbi:MAG TPA: zinc dependent phospholipase C family protein [Candidatus Sulfotelmatobacter sp.]|nr:zinc dependent phospholipase C family protein [Candidatus Sulfotelmatobacter sp.]
MRRMLNSWRSSIWLGLAILVAQVCMVQTCAAYSVLTHEEIVDLAWKDNLVPLLKKRFPDATDDDLKKAHAFAYGGSVMQDMGYYPFGSKHFSDLTHYVRSGDFIVNLLKESSDLDEYAFALGALAHYSADNCGHPTINQAVGLEFPKLRKKYGNIVTYEDNPKAHIRTEFGFDVTQVAKRRYTSDAYHDFIGFEISKPVLERAFQDTYGIPLTDILSKEDLAIGTFRRAISTVIPEMTRVALVARRQEIVSETPNFRARQFRYYLSRASYQKEWGRTYQRPGFGTRLLAFFVRFMPKIGPFKALDFKIPSQKTEDLYIASVDKTVQDYTKLLHETSAGDLHLTNTDFDTGHETRAGEYELTDKAYAHLLDELAKNNFDKISPDLRANILTFYGDPNAPNAMKKKPADWEKTHEELAKLRMLPESAPAGGKADGQIEPEPKSIELLPDNSAPTE